MNVVVIGDIHVLADYYAEQISQLPWLRKPEIKKYHWYPETKEAFQEAAQKIEKTGPETSQIPSGLLADCADAQAIFTHFCPVNRAMIRGARHLQLIGTCRGGVEHISPEAKARGIPVISVVRNAEPVADFTLGLLLAEYRNIARGHHALRASQWQKGYPNSGYLGNLRDLTVGVIGFGAIGQLVARKLRALGMRVLVHDPYVSPQQRKEIDGLAWACSLTDLLQESDVVTLHVRSAQGQPPILDRQAFEQMKPGAFLINTSRAYAVEEVALIEALTNKQIAGAALDVFWEEPIPLDHPLLSLDNVTLTPHIAGDTPQAISKSPKLLVEKIVAHCRKSSVPLMKCGVSSRR